MPSELETAYEHARAWCRARDYAGHDPFDALNSPLFRATPLARSRLARLAWTQLFKRSPVNLRPLALVPAERNAKGTALFALAALARVRALRASGDAAGEREYEREARALLEDLSSARLEGLSGAAWGYNFDWQGRAFYAPRGTPAIVPTAFAARAFVEAARALGDVSYTKTARSVCDFILRDLRRTDEAEDEVCFSYTPVDRTRVFNASLLAGEVLASVGSLTGERELLDWALRAARYVVRRQRADGSWPYGADEYQSWSDNFHTAFVLTSLARVREACAPAGHDDGSLEELGEALRRGYDFWRASFFLAGGGPKYYHDRAYPFDTHSAAAAVVALTELRALDPAAPAFAEEVARWTLRNLRDPARGFFYYQRRRTHTVRTPFMRWSQAWMLYALARLIETMNAER
ncbi:MAG TPA: hypothetical protein VGV38_14920 [Pyrinomonadaceae bacterium]|nr:hypothetical protein [Pyrinomonadaceae bacterium]